MQVWNLVAPSCRLNRRRVITTSAHRRRLENPHGDLLGVVLGNFLAGVFLLSILLAAVLATLAVLEGFGGRPVFRRWRTQGSRWDRFLIANADVNEALSLLATAALIAWALVTTTTDGMRAFLEWTQLGVLGVRAAWLILFLYLLFGTIKLVSEQVTDEAQPFLQRFIRAVLRQQPSPEELALLNYSWDPRVH
jgi:hypothetical protein